MVKPVSIWTPIRGHFVAIYIIAYPVLVGNYLLSPSQHGFRRGLSCEAALNTIVEHLRAIYTIKIHLHYRMIYNNAAYVVRKNFQKIIFPIARYPLPCLFLEIQVTKKSKDIFFFDC